MAVTRNSKKSYSAKMPGSVIPPCGESLPPEQNRPGGCIATARGLGILGWQKGMDGSTSLKDVSALQCTSADKTAMEEADWSDPMEENPPGGSSEQKRRDAPGQPGSGKELGHDLSNELARRLPAATTNLPTSRLNTVEAGATMVEVRSYFYWSYTYVYVQRHRLNKATYP